MQVGAELKQPAQVGKMLSLSFNRWRLPGADSPCGLHSMSQCDEADSNGE